MMSFKELQRVLVWHGAVIDRKGDQVIVKSADPPILSPKIFEAIRQHRRQILCDIGLAKAHKAFIHGLAREIAWEETCQAIREGAI